MKLNYKSVVAIDDNSFSLTFIEDQLKSVGIERVACYDNPITALDYLATEDVLCDLIILDLQMPQMDGIRLLNRLAQLHFKGAIIIYSGFETKVLTLAEQIASQNDLSILGSLPKPFTLNQLIELLDVNQNIEQALNSADNTASFCLSDGELILTRQPQISLQTGAVVGYEVLSRWRTQSGIILPPVYFIEQLESEGDIALFQERLFDLAIKKIGEDKSAAKYSINLSINSIESQDIPSLIFDTAHKYNVPLERITIEITEARVNTCMHKIKEVLTRLRLMGVTLSIDDFGTGYSTLDKLCDLPFKEVKLDRRYVSGCNLSKEKQAIIKSTVQIANSMGLLTVAEGMECKREVEIVTELGVDIGQGYYFSKPQVWI